MAERGLPISTFVKISTQIAAGGVLRTEYGAGLLVTTEDGIPAGGARKIKGYRDIEAVQTDFDTGEAAGSRARVVRWRLRAALASTSGGGRRRMSSRP